MGGDWRTAERRFPVQLHIEAAGQPSASNHKDLMFR